MRRLKKDKLVIHVICFIIIGLLCFPLQNEGPRVEPSVYQDLLAEYERVIEDESYTEEEWSNNIYDHVKRHIGKTQLSYCIKDLAGDGKPELILGVFRHEKHKILGTIYESEYEPFIIYTYDDEGIHWNCISEEYIMTIYKDGIVELISGGHWQHFMYKQIEKNEVYEKNMDIIVCAQADDEEADYYKCEIDGDEYKDITEKEFYNIRNQYTAFREELEWNPVEGFWNGENMEKERTHFKGLTIIIFLVILAACVYCFKTIYERKKLDVWTGEYAFSDTFEHNSGEMHYVVDYELIIYRDGGKYYAELEGNGWFLQTRSLAYIEGDENSIDIIFKSSLPGDSLYGRAERYEEDELMLTLSYDDSQLISSWHALRNEHPIFIESVEEIKGIYFDRIH